MQQHRRQRDADREILQAAAKGQRVSFISAGNFSCRHLQHHIKRNGRSISLNQINFDITRQIPHNQSRTGIPITTGTELYLQAAIKHATETACVLLSPQAQRIGRRRKKGAGRERREAGGEAGGGGGEAAMGEGAGAGKAVHRAFGLSV